MILALWWSSLKRNVMLSSLLLVLASMDRLYPVQLIIPILLLLPKRDERVRIILYSACWTGLIFLTENVFDKSETISNWRLILNLYEYQPGLNVTWYMLIELFDHFRQFFIFIVQVNEYEQLLIYSICIDFLPLLY